MQDSVWGLVCLCYIWNSSFLTSIEQYVLLMNKMVAASRRAYIDSLPDDIYYAFVSAHLCINFMNINGGQGPNIAEMGTQCIEFKQCKSCMWVWF